MPVLLCDHQSMNQSNNLSFNIIIIYGCKRDVKVRDQDETETFDF